MKLIQCCDEPRGFVGGTCDHCGEEVQPEFTNLELQQQVSGWRNSSYYLEMDRDKWKAAAVAFEKERDEAVNSCHIWRSGHSALVRDRDEALWERDQLTNKIAAEREGWKTIAVELEKELAIVRKQNNERLTLLQENGLAEYGN